jgi:hypothetical protein
VFGYLAVPSPGNWNYSRGEPSHLIKPNLPDEAKNPWKRSSLFARSREVATILVLIDEARGSQEITCANFQQSPPMRRGPLLRIWHSA